MIEEKREQEYKFSSRKLHIIAGGEKSIPVVVGGLKNRGKFSHSNVLEVLAIHSLVSLFFSDLLAHVE